MVITVQYGKAFWRKLEGSDNQSEMGRKEEEERMEWKVIGLSWLPLRGGKQMGQGSKARLGTSLLTLSQGLVQGSGTIGDFTFLLYRLFKFWFTSRTFKYSIINNNKFSSLPVLRWNPCPFEILRDLLCFSCNLQSSQGPHCCRNTLEDALNPNTSGQGILFSCCWDLEEKNCSYHSQSTRLHDRWIQTFRIMTCLSRIERCPLCNCCSQTIQDYFLYILNDWCFCARLKQMWSKPYSGIKSYTL